jgi:Family of unknown function (DUF5706)
MDETTHAEQVNDKKVQMAWQLFVSLEYQVQVADRKVQAVFGMNAFLVAAISLQNQKPLHDLLQNGLVFSIWIDLLLKTCFLACVAIATWSALKALRPRISNKGSRFASPITSLYYFGDIQTKTYEQFCAAFLTQTNEETVKQLLNQVQTISKILSRKYFFLQRSTLFLSVALIIWLLLTVTKFLS